jgi:hypothetical protein
MAVTVSGTPPFGYQWRRDGTNLSDGGNVIGSTTASLTLLNVSEAASARYQAVITNSVGSVTSSVAILIVDSVPAKATPVIFNGFIVGAILTDGGCGYTTSPVVAFSGIGGSGALGYGQISSGSVANVVITAAGIGYPSNTICQVGPSSLPTANIVVTNTPAAVAVPVSIGGFIVGASLTDSGSGYTTAPPVSFVDVSGNGATAYAQIANGAVTNIVITSAGSGYSDRTVITIPPAAYMNAVVAGAGSLMPGQSYQLQIAHEVNDWTDYGPTFFATNSVWVARDYLDRGAADRVFFRLRMLPSP